MVARNSARKLSLEWFKEQIKRARDEFPAASEMIPTMVPNTENAISFARFPTLKEAETELINRALELAKGNQGIAASLLGISRQALNNRLRRSS